MLNSINIKSVKVKTGDMLKLLRKRAGVTQEQLGEQLGLSRITIQNIESGKNATMDTLLKVLQHWDMLGGVYGLVEKEIYNNSHESLY